MAAVAESAALLTKQMAGKTIGLHFRLIIVVSSHFCAVISVTLNVDGKRKKAVSKHRTAIVLGSLEFIFCVFVAASRVGNNFFNFFFGGLENFF